MELTLLFPGARYEVALFIVWAAASSFSKRQQPPAMHSHAQHGNENRQGQLYNEFAGFFCCLTQPSFIYY